MQGFFIFTLFFFVISDRIFSNFNICFCFIINFISLNELLSWYIFRYAFSFPENHFVYIERHLMEYRGNPIVNRLPEIDILLHLYLLRCSLNWLMPSPIFISTLGLKWWNTSNTNRECLLALECTQDLPVIGFYKLLVTVLILLQ